MTLCNLLLSCPPYRVAYWWFSLSPSACGPFRRGRQERNHNLETYIRSQLEPFRSQMVRGIPEADLPPLEPFHIKTLDFDLDKFGVHLDVFVRNIKIIGMSGFTDSQITATSKRITAIFKVPNVNVLGNYKIDGHLTWLPGVKVDGNGPVLGKVGILTNRVTMDYEHGPNGVVITNIETNMDFDDVHLRLENLLEGSIFSSAVSQYINSNAKTYLIGLKDEPEWLMGKIMRKVFGDMLTKFYDYGHTRQKRQLFKCGQANMNSVLDNVIESARPFIQSTADPFPLPNINETEYFILHDGKVVGLSTIYRSGNSALECDDANLEAAAELSLATVGASYDWTGTVPYINYKLSGKVIIQITNATAEAIVKQERKQGARPVLERLDLKTSGVRINFTGLGPFSFALSHYISIISNIFKDEITSWIESPIKTAIQDQLNKISIPF